MPSLIQAIGRSWPEKQGVDYWGHPRTLEWNIKGYYLDYRSTHNDIEPVAITVL
jgi:hypothetical protein